MSNGREDRPRPPAINRIQVIMSNPTDKDPVHQICSPSSMRIHQHDDPVNTSPVAESLIRNPDQAGRRLIKCAAKTAESKAEDAGSHMYFPETDSSEIRKPPHPSHPTSNFQPLKRRNTSVAKKAIRLFPSVNG
jgi:hypothetical protein